ncbi:MAG: hypothetical protein QM695_10650 [Micropruina sp.]
MSWPAPTGEPVQPPRGPAGAPDGYPAQPPAPTGAPTHVSGGYPTAPYPPAGRAPDTHAAPLQAPATTAPASGLPSGPGAATPPESAGPPGAAVEAAPSAQIDTLAPLTTESTGLAPLNPKTGQPTRPWTVWTSAVLLFGGAIVVIVGLLQAMWAMASPWQQVSDDEWTKVDRFNEATWLTAQFPSEPASGMRVLFAVVCCLIAVLVAGFASVIGYYAFAGYRWTRIGSLVALGVSLLALMLTPLTSASIGLAALGAAPLWLPATRRFFARWQLIRHPQIVYSEPIDQVFYGPLPRYR